MPVFRMYMKIVRSKFKVIFLYTVVFIGIFYAVTQYYASTDALSTNFNQKDISISIQDNDESELSKGFIKNLATTANIVELEDDDEEAIKDALFYGEISYAIMIPKGFENAFFTENPLDIDTISRPDSASGMMMLQPINSYLSSVKTYHEVNPTQSIKDITNRVSNAFAEKTTIEIAKADEIDSASRGRGMFFNYLSYMFTFLSMLVGGIIFLRVYDTEIRKRNMVSPVSNLSFNLQLALASITVAFVLWIIYMIDLQITIGGLLTTQGLFYMANSVLLVLVSMGFTFLVVNILAGKKNQDDALNGIANLYCLGTSFLCGVFIPQEIIGEGVRAIASFLPNFWYIKANDLLVNMKDFDFNSMQEVYKCFGIELLFAIAFFAVAMYISKTKTNMKEL